MYFKLACTCCGFSSEVCNTPRAQQLARDAQKESDGTVDDVVCRNGSSTQSVNIDPRMPSNTGLTNGVTSAADAADLPALRLTCKQLAVAADNRISSIAVQLTDSTPLLAPQSLLGLQQVTHVLATIATPAKAGSGTTRYGATLAAGAVDAPWLQLQQLAHQLPTLQSLRLCTLGVTSLSAMYWLSFDSLTRLDFVVASKPGADNPDLKGFTSGGISLTNLKALCLTTCGKDAFIASLSQQTDTQGITAAVLETSSKPPSDLFTVEVADIAQFAPNLQHLFIDSLVVAPASSVSMSSCTTYGGREVIIAASNTAEGQESQLLAFATSFPELEVLFTVPEFRCRTDYSKTYMTVDVMPGHLLRYCRNLQAIRTDSRCGTWLGLGQMRLQHLRQLHLDTTDLHGPKVVDSLAGLTQLQQLVIAGKGYKHAAGVLQDLVALPVLQTVALPCRTLCCSCCGYAAYRSLQSLVVKSSLRELLFLQQTDDQHESCTHGNTLSYSLDSLRSIQAAAAEAAADDSRSESQPLQTPWVYHHTQQANIELRGFRPADQQLCAWPGGDAVAGRSSGAARHSVWGVYGPFSRWC